MSNDDKAKIKYDKYAVFLQKPSQLVDQSEFICGWCAAFINITVTYLIYKIIFRPLRSEGITFVYRGIFPQLAQTTVSLALMFGVYDGTLRQLVYVGFNPYIAKVIAGVTAGTVDACIDAFRTCSNFTSRFNIPLDVQKYRTAIRYVWTNHGFVELYRGLTPILLRNGPSNAMLC